jgi:lipoprotein-anchoring transpeptidase ErfK/SrfK
MRRHVENQVEDPGRESLGIIVLFVMWALALMALSAAAHGEERQDQQPVAAPEQEKPGAVQKAPEADRKADSKANRTDGAQHRLSAQHHLPLNKKTAQKTTDSTENPVQPSEEITLTRFILISIPDRQLALVDNGEVVKTYPIAVGANHTPSPEGNFTIISHVADPSWTHKGKVMAPGKDNPVGSRWMGLSLKGYGIHGTNAPRSIGKAASHGCFRMGRKDVEELFKLVRVGDTVAVRAERDDLVAQVFGAGSNGEVQVAAATATATVDADEE